MDSENGEVTGASPEGSVDEAARAITALIGSGDGDGQNQDQTKEAEGAEQSATADGDGEGAEKETTEGDGQKEDRSGDEGIDAQPSEEGKSEDKAQASDQAPSQLIEDKPTEEEKAVSAEVQKLQQTVNTLNGQIAAEFPDIKTEADLMALMDTPEGVDRYNRFVRLATRLQSYNGQLARGTAWLNDQWQARQAAILGRQFPVLNDPAKKDAFISELRSYAEKAGYTREQIGRASASDWVTLHKAMLFDKAKGAEAAKAKERATAIEEARKKAAKAPPVQKPGTPTRTTNQDRLQEDFSRLRKSGHVNDAASVIKRLGI